jgi:hypothetical protein
MNDYEQLDMGELDSRLGEAVHALICAREGLNAEDYVLSQVLNLYPGETDIDLGVRAYKTIRYLGVLPEVSAAADTKALLESISVVRKLDYSLTYVYVICNMLLDKAGSPGMTGVRRQLNAIMSKLNIYNNVEGRMLNLASCMNMLPAIYSMLTPITGNSLRLQRAAIESVNGLASIAAWYGQLIHWYNQHEEVLAGLS